MYKLTLLSLLLPLLLCGQQADVPLVMYANGSIAYDSPASSRPVRVHTGTYLTGAGTLSLQEAAVLEVARGNQFVRLDSAGSYVLDELFIAEPESDGFISRFLQFVRRGLQQSASSGNLEKAYLENQGNAQGNIQGFGDGGLAGLLPFGGTLGPELTHFNWPGDGSTGGTYRLRIVDSLTEAVLLGATARDTSLRIDLAGLSLQDGQTYYWEVFPNQPAGTGGPKRLGVRPPTVVGSRIYFTYRDRSVDELVTHLRVNGVYQATQSEAQRMLMEAMTYEADGYLYAADRAYRRGLAEDAGNELLIRSYAAFLSRWNQRGLAKQVLHMQRLE
ncbi:hypothetical protein LEM8419_00423 [Neolewinella maritima]|uniref:Uncharacterized protein n=1 Tax=Neolewinella maritima TaxID=1383882 RepID=A0ABM9AX75_9BACT|nr:hypothetical protein [Neolewinella maritima]CAH0999127.1 hypothetical protein LEM8419_00423 [Neolewinella maritima]